MVGRHAQCFRADLKERPDFVVLAKLRQQIGREPGDLTRQHDPIPYGTKGLLPTFLDRVVHQYQSVKHAISGEGQAPDCMG